MFNPCSLRRRRLPPLVRHEHEQHRLQTGSFADRTLRLGIVHNGPYVPWGSIGTPGQEPLWVVDPSLSRMELSNLDEEQDDEDCEEEGGEERGGSYHHFGRMSDSKVLHAAAAASSSEWQKPHNSESSEDDPQVFIMAMKKDLDLQHQMLHLLMLAHKKAREDWARTPFKMVGLEGHGEAEILKLLFLVADAPLDDERITAEQVDELKSQTPYGEFPTISKCGLTFGDASAISMAVATKFQLVGETVQEQLVVGATYSRLRRLQEKHRRTLAWVMCGQVKDKAKIEWAQGQLLHVILPPAIKEWDQQIRSTKGPFLVESGMTLADVAIMDFLDQCSSHVMIDGLLVDYLAVSDMTEAVRSCPRLLAYLQNREED